MPQRETIADILDANIITILRSVTGGSCVLVDPEVVSLIAKPISQAVELTTDDAVLLAKLLLDVESWFFAQKRCLPRGTANIHLNSPSGSTKVLIDMACQGWELFTDSLHAGGFFDPVAGQVRDLLKRTFPDIASTDPRSMWKAGAISRLKQLADENEVETE